MRLASCGSAEYAGLHGVCCSIIHRGLGRESYTLRLGAAHAAQPTLSPESRHLFHFHRQAYCLAVMQRIVRVTVWEAVGAAALATLYSWLAATVGVSFYRPVPLDNDPLTNSVAVTSVSSNRFTLADGRVLVMEEYPGDFLADARRDFGGRIELDSADTGFASVFVKSKRFICGTHAPRVVVPLIRREYPAYEKRWLGMGTLP